MMNEPHEKHLAKIKAEFAILVDQKYRKGQKEHGGKLWEKPGLIDMALEEAIDMVVYLLSLKDQLEGNTMADPNALDLDDPNTSTRPTNA